MRRLVCALTLAVGATAALGGPSRTEVYDVRDLIRVLGPESVLANRIRDLGRGVGTVTAGKNGFLDVRGSAAAQKKVAALLVRLRRRARQRVKVRARFLLTPRSLAGAKSHDPWFVRRLRPKAAIRILETAAADRKGSRIVVAPALVARRRKAAQTEVGSCVSYVKRYQLERRPNGDVIAHPVIESVFDGFTIRVTPVPGPGPRISRLVVEVALHRVVEPLDHVRKELPSGLVVGVQIPELRETRTRKVVAVPAGHPVLLGLGTDPKDEARHVSVMLTAVQTTSPAPEPRGAEGGRRNK